MTYESFLRRWPVSAVAVIILVVIGTLANLYGSLAFFDRRLVDAQFTYLRSNGGLPTVNEPVIVGIDQRFLDSVDEPLALSHHYLAELLEALTAAKPAVFRWMWCCPTSVLTSWCR